MNSKIVQSTKEILKEFGIEIKTTQIYEMYSKILGEKNWNIAKSKNVDFSKVFYSSLKLEDLAKNLEKIDKDKFVKEFFKRKKMIFEDRKSDVDEFGISGILISINGERSVVFIKNKNYFNLNFKHINNLTKSMEKNNCVRALIITNEVNLSSDIYKLAKDFDIDILDNEDLLLICRRVDNVI